MKKGTWALRFSVSVLVAVQLILGTPFVTLAQEVGRVTSVEGRADILKAGTDIPVPARTDEVVNVGDIVRTKSDSKIEVTFQDKSIVRLAENSRVKVEDYQLDGENKRKTATINLERGKVRTIIEKMADAADFKIHTPNAHGTITGSDVFAFFQAGSSGMLVSEGHLQLINPNVQAPPVIVSPGNSALIPINEAPKGPRPYLELEKTFYERDTNPPPTISARPDATRIEGVVTKVSGKVTLIKEGSREGQSADVHQVVRMGDTLETGDDGLIELKFDNGNALNLKPNTSILLTKLVVDPKTREFENLLEANLGKVRATVENIQGGSSFQVKTPHAISGVRGTLIYLIIAQTFTKIFFEGGPGFIKSLVTGVTKEVPMGHSAYADDQGFISDPVPILGIDRMEFAEGWTPGSGVEGYSRPDGVTGDYLYDADTSVEAVAEEGTGESAAEGENQANGGTGERTNNRTTEIPITVSNPDSGSENSIGNSPSDEGNSPSQPPPSEPPPSEPPPSEPPPSENFFSTGEITANFGFFDDVNNQLTFGSGTFQGNMQMENTLWDGSEPITLSGTFSQTPEEVFMNLWTGTVSGNGNDGSDYLGIISGVHGSLLGTLYAYYIRPDGNGGFLSGYLTANNITGDFDANAGTFAATGLINVVGANPTSIPPEDLFTGSPSIINESSIVSGGIFGNGISGSVQFLGRSHLADQPWGLWSGALGGTYQSLPEGWNAKVGLTSLNNNVIDGYGVGTLGLNGQDGDLSGVLIGRILTGASLQSFQGTTLGTYVVDGTGWQALSVGSTLTEPLAFGGSFNTTFGSDPTTTMTSLLGGTQSLWVGSVPVTLMGQFSDPGNFDFWTYNDFNLTGKSADGATFLGAFGGSKVFNATRNLLYAFYIRPDGLGGNLAGYIKSNDLNGLIYRGINMLEMDGTVQSNLEVTTTFLPADLSINGPALDIEAVGTGRIGNENFSANFQVNAAHISNQNWGLFWFNTGGNYQSLPTDGWTAKAGGSTVDTEDSIIDGYWLGEFTGGAWQNNQISATGSGRSISYNPFRPLEDFGDNALATFQGDLLGIYENTGRWFGLGTGVYSETSIFFAAKSDGQFGFYNSGLGDLTSSGSLSSIFGSVSNIWSGTSPLTVIGEFVNPDNYTLWGNQNFIPGKTGDGGALLGFMAGVNTLPYNQPGDSLLGLWNSLYIRPDGLGGFRAGYVKSSDLTGNFYPAIGMFEADGTLTSHFDFPTGYTPADLFEGSPAIFVEPVSTGLISGNTFSGTFRENDFWIRDQNWDFWKVSGGGTFSSLPSNNWQAVAGLINSDLQQTNGTSYSIGHVTGNLWANGKLRGTISGRYMDFYDLGSGAFNGTIIADLGDLIGTYDANPSGTTWQAVGLGIGGVEVPLSLGGKFTGKFGDFATGIFDQDIANGNITGLLGATVLPFSGPTDVVLMGEFINDGRKLWATTSGSFTGYLADGTVFRGGIGGINANNTLKGLLNAFYIRPDGNGGNLAGYLKSADLSGNFYPGIGMFEADGTVNSFFGFQTGFTPADLLSGAAIEVNNNTILTNISGDNGITGTLSVQNAGIVDQDNWDLWWGYSGGTFSSAPTGPWQVSMGGFSRNNSTLTIESYFLGTTFGQTPVNNILSATVNGNYLYLDSYGTIEGDFVGTYNENAQTWQAVSSGVSFDTADLTSSGDFFFGFSDFQPDDSALDGFHGLLGLTDSLWDNGSAHFISIGELNPNFSLPFIWHSSEDTTINQIGLGRGAFFSNTHQTGSQFPFTTFPLGGVGAFYGLSGGIGRSDLVLEGRAAGIYTMPLGDTGVMLADLTGNYWGAPINMYRLDGDFTLGVIRLGGQNPLDLFNNIRIHELSSPTAFGRGNFGAGGSVVLESSTAAFLNLAGQNWGVYNYFAEGTLGIPVSNDWQLLWAMTGKILTSPQDPLSELVGGAWLGSIEGTQWSQGKLAGDLKAIGVVLEPDGTLSGRKMNDKVIGNYVEVGEASLWQATSTGEWVEADDLLNLAGNADDIESLGLPNIPVTEIYTSLLTGAGTFNAGGTLTLNNFLMDFYTQGVSSGIWAANLSGDYAGLTGNDFIINASGNLVDSNSGSPQGTVNATLTGTQWADGHWRADVSGSSDIGINLTGVAGGTFDAPTAGTFAGSGTGTWNVQ